jgi:TonB family protein
MRTQVCLTTISTLIFLVGLSIPIQAKRPVADKDTLSLPAPQEILKLTPQQFTVPRQTVFNTSDLSHYLDGRPPLELWYKISFDESRKRVNELVYSSRQVPGIDKLSDKIMGGLVLRTPIDSGSAHGKPPYWYHRVILIPAGEKLTLDPNALPVLNDLPKPVMSSDSELVLPQLTKQGNLEHYVLKVGFSGTVTMKCLVGKEGKVKVVSVQTSSGDPGFDAIVVAAAYKNEYKPATRKGQPVDAEVLWRYEYNVHE